VGKQADILLNIVNVCVRKRIIRKHGLESIQHKTIPGSQEETEETPTRAAQAARVFYLMRG